MPEPELIPPELRRDARLLRRARAIAAVALPLLLWTEPLDGTPAATLPPVPLGVLLGGVLLLVNLVDPTVDPRASRQLIERRAVIELVLDTAVMGSVVWLVALDPVSSLWVLLLLPVLEAALRFRVRGVVLATLTISLLYVCRDAFVANRYVEVTFDASTVLQRISVLGIVALAAGSLEARLAREAWRHRQVRADAERRSAILAAVADASAEMTTLDLRRVRAAIHRALERIELEGRVLPPETDVPPGHLSIPIMFGDHLRGRIVVADPVPVEAHGAIELLATQAGAVVGQVEAFLEAEELRKKLEHQVYHDPLTGLRNRAAFDMDLREQSERRRPPGEGLAVLFLDLDGFKLVNDRLGHEAGDVLLEAAARRLEACVRPDDLVARLGGDEFTILLPGAVDV
ncbi:MAG: GGDEF domain-containing protein, partial [Actinomycetota bacterium]|nr:GGDEF domain-containing protein [Actinomycetota bacterium]